MLYGLVLFENMCRRPHVCSDTPSQPQNSTFRYTSALNAYVLSQCTHIDSNTFLAYMEELKGVSTSSLMYSNHIVVSFQMHTSIAAQTQLEGYKKKKP